MEGGDDGAAEGEEQHPGDEHGDAGEDRRIGQASAHPVEAPGAPVLAEDRPDRSREREEYAEGDRHQPVHDRQRRHCRIAETGDHTGEDRVRDRVREIGQDRRPGDREGPGAVLPDEREARALDHAVYDHAAVEADRADDDPRQHDRDRGAVRSEPEAEDQERVEPRRDDAAAERHEHRAPGIADGAQDAGEAHADRHQGIGRQHDVEEGESDGMRLVVRAEQAEQPRQDG